MKNRQVDSSTTLEMTLKLVSLKNMLIKYN